MGMLAGIVDTAMQIRQMVEKDDLAAFIFDAQVPTVMASLLFIVSVCSENPSRPFLVAFLQPHEQSVIGPIRQLAGGRRGVDVFVVLSPPPQDSIEASDLFQWRLVEGAPSGQPFDRVLEPLDAFLAGRDA